MTSRGASEGTHVFLPRVQRTFILFSVLREVLGEEILMHNKI